MRKMKRLKREVEERRIGRYIQREDKVAVGFSLCSF
jgi:hypothetical protein